MIKGYPLPIFRLFFLLGISAYIFSCSHIDEETPKSFVRLISADTAKLRQSIEGTLLKGDKVEPQLLVLTPTQGLAVANIDFGWITSNGSIVAYSKKFSLVTIFEPKLGNNMVSWGCVIYPAEAKPDECGDWTPLLKEQG